MLCRAQTQAALGRALVGQRRWSEARDQLDAAMKAAPGRRHPLDWLRHAQACEQMALESDGTPALLSFFVPSFISFSFVHACTAVSFVFAQAGCGQTPRTPGGTLGSCSRRSCHRSG